MSAANYRNTAPDASPAPRSGQGAQLPQRPALTLPKGGGAIGGMGEKFAANPVTGTGALSVPIATSPGRAGWGPRLSLTYDSGAGNGPFGFGWTLGQPAVTRKTDKGLPRYPSSGEPDVFVLSGAEDLVPELVEEQGVFGPSVQVRQVWGRAYRIERYRPRSEGLFARIERWSNQDDASDVSWRAISKDNITTWYGRRPDSRISDPFEPTRIFSWLICESHDDKGNVMAYTYKPEDSAGVDVSAAHERNRTDVSRAAQRYVKRIRYGSRTPYFPTATTPDIPTLPDDWLFELVFDYGEHEAEVPRPEESAPWPARPDPFSRYRAGFEIRTYRLCRRALMFHHVPELGATPCLVRSTDFLYSRSVDPTNTQQPVFSFLLSAQELGYTRRTDDTYLAKSRPPLELEYSSPVIQSTVHELDEESLDGLPAGLDPDNVRWVDLEGEGCAGMLVQHAGAWTYKGNLSPAQSGEPDAVRFGPLERLGPRPSLVAAGRSPQFLDLAGDGLLDVVEMARPVPGFYERTAEHEWERFVSFTSLPVLDWSDPNLRFVDLTGNGLADVLITEHDALCWHPSLGEAGFGAAERLAKALDEEHGPNLVFADGTQSLYLADMSGNRLSDLVRVRNGDVCYWPNLGYGRFGAKVTMDGAPWFDAPDRFDQRRVRMADIDGDGTVDILYLTHDTVDVYFNQAGNAWGPGQTLSAFPAVDDVAAVNVADLMGNGTACLVWSSPLPGHARSPIRYVDLMGGVKPHLLVKAVNNLGAETFVHYAPSTKFQAADAAAGRPWITRIPFPVHVVERVETIDRISGNRFVTRYAYHHGFFDGVEREFRGFGMVEQWDTEELAALSDTGTLSDATNLDPVSHVPPVLTRTWFHTGVHLGRDRVSDYFAGLRDGPGEYYREPETDDDAARRLLLDDTVLPPGLSGNEEREACRALKGSMLRQEVYALDGSARQTHPYVVTEQSFTVRRVQPQADNPYGVFFVHPRESLVQHYERDPADPRVVHSLTLAVDELGNVLRSATVAYGRRTPDATLPPADQAEQALIHARCSEQDLTNAIEQDDDHSAPLPAVARQFEVTGLPRPGPSRRLGFDEVLDALDRAVEIPHQQEADLRRREKRLIAHTRVLYRPNDLGARAGGASTLLPLGSLESLALSGETYTLAFSSGLLEARYGSRASAFVLATEGGYVDVAGDGSWWVPSGRVFLSIATDDGPAEELSAARAHFFSSRRFRDPFGNEAVATADAYDLLPIETRDALGNTVRSVNDYRVQQPRLVTDPNGNRSEAAFDALGMVAGTAVMGKIDETAGDTLDGFEPDLTDAEVLAHLDDPLGTALAILQGATTRLVYDLFAYQRSRLETRPAPGVVCSITRDTHAADLLPGATPRIQHSVSYSDGFGREIQRKTQAGPGPLAPGDPEVAARWIGSGWMVFNNKGKPVRQYEPFFTGTHRFELDLQRGVSPIVCYDPLQRAVATLHPNHTWQKVVFDPWRQAVWDVNDTALEADPAADEDVGDSVARLPQSIYLPTWFAQRVDGSLGPLELAAATRTIAHAETPALSYTDGLGRTFLHVGHNRTAPGDGAPDGPVEEAFHRTRVTLDIQGRTQQVVDALARVVARYAYDMLDNQAYAASMDAGERWRLNDVAGQSIRAWDSRGHVVRTEYDALRRPVRTFVAGGDPTQSDPRVVGREVLVEQIEYGEELDDDVSLNLRTRVATAYDGAGVTRTEEYDFKGNLLRSSRQLARDYKGLPDWSSAVALEEQIYSTSSTYDARNRPISTTSPDGTMVRPRYDDAGMLAGIDASLRGETRENEPVWTPFVADVAYNARRERERIDYGNGVRTTYTRDPLTFRLTQLFTRRDPAAFPDDCVATPPAGWPGCAVQNLRYTYDPAGNLTHVADEAQQTIYFRNRRVDPSSEFRYDAIYQLIEATGREHQGQNGDGQPGPTVPDADNAFHTGLVHRGDGAALGRYTESYGYDPAGNILEMRHRGSDPAHPGWVRTYNYSEASLIEPDRTGNRLSSTQVNDVDVERYAYDAHGSMTVMPHLPLMQWTWLDQLQASARQVVGEGLPETTYYVYDGSGQRLRKVTERRASANGQAVRTRERIYLGGFEIYRELGPDGAAIALERETLHVLDGQQRLALVETKTIDASAALPLPSPLIRYQLGNHLGSSSLEVDDDARVISYQEYLPFGSTSYQAYDSLVEAPAKRYQYSGKERDEETGFYYHGARYFAAWLGRWTACDPLIHASPETSPYRGMGNSPALLSDPDGRHESMGAVLHEQRMLGPEGHRIAHREQIAAGTAVGQALQYVLSLPPVAGGLQLVAGGLEYMGAAALMTAPEPLSKIAAGVLFVHGTDTLAAGVDTLTSGTVKQTRTAQAGEAFAKKLDAPPGVVKAVGVLADVAPSFGATGLVVASGALNSTRLSRLMVPTPGTFTWGRGAATEIIVPVPRAAHLAKDVADLYEDAVMLAAERSRAGSGVVAHVVPLDQIANYPNATKVVFFGHSNQFTLGGLQADDLNTVLVNAGLRPDIIELAGCSTGAPIGRLEGLVTRHLQRIDQPLAPGVVSLSGRPVTAYTGPISVQPGLLNNRGVGTAAFGEWHDLWGGGRLYSDADQIFFRPTAPGP